MEKYGQLSPSYHQIPTLSISLWLWFILSRWRMRHNMDRQNLEKKKRADSIPGLTDREFPQPGQPVFDVSWPVGINCVWPWKKSQIILQSTLSIFVNTRYNRKFIIRPNVSRYRFNPSKFYFVTHYEMSYVMRKPVFAICEQQRHSLISAFVVRCLDSIISLLPMRGLLEGGFSHITTL